MEASDKKGAACHPSASILIVDDNLQYTQVLRRMLEGALGYSQITSVDNPSEAFELITRQPERFQVLFVDYHFPNGESGGGLLQRLKEAALLSDKAAFLITADPTVENMKEALSYGALGVVAKPFDRDELRRQLNKVKRSAELDEGEAF
jgi:DNA-binding NtrC family response regulator